MVLLKEGVLPPSDYQDDFGRTSQRSRGSVRQAAAGPHASVLSSLKLG